MALGDGSTTYAIYFVARGVAVEFPVFLFQNWQRICPSLANWWMFGIVPCGVRGCGEGLTEPKLRRATLLGHMLSTGLQWVFLCNFLAVFFPEMAHNWIMGGPALAKLWMLGSGAGGRG
jgi:hypothetical protein